ncbi:MAG: hypothetical protein JSV62_07190 [Promethearchaeota archaeon]|nr:MAG: hypothetical protein JSV62_07190 [Candidatus Lokiarchaeota archaeon]
MDIFYENEFYDKLISDFAKYEYNEKQQSFVLYKSIIEFFKLLKVVNDPDFFVNGLLYMNGFLRILKEHYKVKNGG